MAGEVHITNGALEIDDDFDEDVLRGTLDQQSISNLLIDPFYQRMEGFSQQEIAEIAEMYFRHEKVTDVILGMRGDRFRQQGHDFWLQDKVFTMDGVQRLYAVKVALHSRPNLVIRLGAKVFFNTNQSIEKEKFRGINANQKRTSASLLVRNERDKSPASKLLFEINRDPAFALKDRIGWDQVLGPGQVLTGFCLARVTGALHGHKGAKAYGKHDAMLATLDRAARKITPQVMYDNLIKFFDVIDDCWTIRDDKRSPVLNQSFLLILARLFSSYDVFWDAEEFYIAAKYQKKLAQFDHASIQTKVKLLQANNVDAKDVLFEVLRNRLNLSKLNMRTPPRDDQVGETPPPA
jgi:hypothetical protein